MITIAGEHLQVDGVQDWYRRDDEGEPVPAEWRDLVGQVRVPWSGASEAGEATA